MKTIMFLNAKGGVGKTTSAINVSYELSQRGYKVLILDLNPQSDISDFFNRYKNTEYTICDLLLKGDLPLDKLVASTDYPNINIIPATLDLGRVEKYLMSDTATPQQFRLKRYLTKLDDRYDYCILDCSNVAENLVNINGLACADFVYIPLQCDKWAVDGLSNTMQIIDTVSAYNEKLRFGGTFFVQWEKRKINQSVYDLLVAELGDKLISHKIRKNKLATESPYVKKPVKAMDKNSTISQDYAELVDYFISQWR